MAFMESRRDFLGKSAILLGSAAVLGVTGCAKQEEAAANAQPELPAYPYPCCEFDLDLAEKTGYEGYFENGCCYGVAKALLTQLSDKVGYPFNVIPPEMFANGKEGYQASSLCGAMGGALGVFGLVLAPDDARALTKQLNAWYTSTALPIYSGAPENKAANTTISATINCSDSVTKFMAANGITEMKDPVRRERCGGVSGDVARKAAELLNIHFGYMAAPVAPEAPATEPELAANEYIGTAQGFSGETKVKVTMDGDKISKIDVLSHGDTDAFFNQAKAVTDSIISAQSVEVDAVTGATFSSKGIMDAVANALAQVK
jgi:uncharacterized protein with FMN-binding domain